MKSQFKRKSQSPILQHKYVDNSIIYMPQEHCVYHIKNISNPNIDTEIIFIGTRYSGNMGGYEFYDIASCYKPFGSGQNCVSSQSTEDYCFIAKEALPKSVSSQKGIPPILVYKYNHPESLFSQPKFEVAVGGQCSLSLTKVTTVNVHHRNPDLLYRKWIGNIPVVYGRYPIFVDSNKPSFEALSSIFQKFISYNSPSKLTYQSIVTKSHCHIRAFFISELLKHVYGVHTELIYKYWEKRADWVGFNQNKLWKFHCAAKVGEWVFDPWEGAHNEWTRLDQWLYQKDEPKPRTLKLSNALVFSDFSQSKFGTRPDGLLIMNVDSLYLSNYKKHIKFLAEDAIPNVPERPISSARDDALLAIQHYGLFKQSTKRIREEVSDKLLEANPLKRFKKC
jgi:hypothetical protein